MRWIFSSRMSFLFGLCLGALLAVHFIGARSDAELTTRHVQPLIGKSSPSSIAVAQQVATERLPEPPSRQPLVSPARPAIEVESQISGPFAPCAKEDTLPVCQAAFEKEECFYATDSQNHTVPNTPVLFFCPCATRAMRRLVGPNFNHWLPETVDADTSRAIWERIVQSLDAGFEHFAVDLLLRSRLFIGSQRLAEVAGRSHMDFWSIDIDGGAPYVMGEMEQDPAYFKSAIINEDELVIDAGSNVGIVSVLTSLRHPKAYILTIEAMPFTWMYQQVNLRMHLPALQFSSKRIVSDLVALGTDNSGPLKMQFRPGSTTSSRNWNPASEASSTLCNVTVSLAALRTIIKRNHLSHLPITWFKIDCEGCEYSAVPDMTDEEIASMHSISGEFHVFHIAHWNPSFLPPLETVLTAHTRLCPKMLVNHNNCEPGLRERLLPLYRQAGKLPG